MQSKPPFPSVVLAVPLKHGGPRKWSWLCGIDRGHAPRLIASYMLRRHGERSLSSPEPKPRPGRPLATTCPPHSNPRAVFNLLNTVAGKKGSSCDLEFPNSQSPKDTANIYASYLRSDSLALSWC